MSLAHLQPLPVRRLSAALALSAALTSATACSAALRSASSDAISTSQDIAAGSERDAFLQDKAPGGLSEDALRALLAAPLQLDASQRLGLVPVVNLYSTQGGALAGVPVDLVRALDSAGLFESSSEISTDWPTDRGIAGLRELAARYHTGYLLLYRQRFSTQDYGNAWNWLWPTVIGPFLAPSRTLEAAGVLEATLFDARSGTLLFTVYERVHAASNETPFSDERKLRNLQQHLIDEGAGKLAEQVLTKLRRLAAVAEDAKQRQAKSVAADN